MNKREKSLFHDGILLAFSCVVAYCIVKGLWVEKLLHYTQGMEIFASFIGGLFFTSLFTTVPAIAFLGEVARENSILTTAFVGACGSLVGDMIIFRFVRSNVSKDLAYMHSRLKHYRQWSRFTGLFHHRLFKLGMWRWVVPFFGALIIASPLPDELGLTVLGLSKIKTRVMIPLTWALNFFGIVIIGLVAKAV
jgi:hypothetical protein